MGGLNDGVYKLDEFCALLGDTHNRLAADHSTMENFEHALEDFDQSVEKTLGALGDAVADFRRRFGEAEQAAAEQVDGLAGDAQQLEASRLPAVQDQIEAAEEAVEGRLTAESTALDQAFAELAGQGFAPLAAGLETLDGAGAAMAQDLERDFSELATALQAGGQRIDRAGDETVAEMTEAADALHGEERGGLEADAAQCLAGWGPELAATLEGQTAELGQEFARVYDEFQSGAEADGQELTAAVDALLQETTEFVREEAGAPLQGALDLAVDQALPALAQELGGLGGMLGAVEEAGAVLVPMVDDLEVACRVMEQIDSLLRAME